MVPADGARPYPQRSDGSTGRMPIGRRVPAVVEEVRHQACLLQAPNGGELGGVDDDSVLRIPPEDERDDTVVTAVGLLPGACPAINGQTHFTNVAVGCDSLLRAIQGPGPASVA